MRDVSMRDVFVSLALTLLTSILLLLRICRFDLYVRFPYILTFCLLFAAQMLCLATPVCFFVGMIKQKSKYAVMHMLLWGATVMMIYFFPATALYERLDLRCNATSRHQIVEMVSNGSIQEYQIGEHWYLSPKRFASYNRRVFVDADVDGLTIAFSAYESRNQEKLIVYSTYAKSELLKTMKYNFSDYEYSKARLLDSNWYYFYLIRTH